MEKGRVPEEGVEEPDDAEHVSCGRVAAEGGPGEEEAEVEGASGHERGEEEEYAEG